MIFPEIALWTARKILTPCPPDAWRPNGPRLGQKEWLPQLPKYSPWPLTTKTLSKYVSYLPCQCEVKSQEMTSGQRHTFWFHLFHFSPVSLQWRALLLLRPTLVNRALSQNALSFSGGLGLRAVVQHCSTLFNIVQLRVGTCRILAAICRLSMQHPSEILGDSEMWWESSYHWGRNLIPERPGPGPHRRYGAPQWSTSMCWGTQASAAPVTRTPDGIGRDTEIQQNQMLPTLNCQVICIVYWLLYLKSSCLVECFLARVEIWVEIHHREKERCVCVCAASSCLKLLMPMQEEFQS